MAFDIEGARGAGYSDDEIADYLAGEAGFDVAGARSAGYSSTEIIGELSKRLGPIRPSRESTAGAGRGEDSFAATDPRRIAAEPNAAAGRRFRGEAPLPPEAQPPQQVIGDVTPLMALSTPVKPGSEGVADLERMSVSPAAQADASRVAAADARRGSARPWVPTVAQEAGIIARQATGSRALGAAAERYIDVGALPYEMAATTAKFGADLANLATLGGAQELSNWAQSVVKAVQDQKSPRFQEQRAKLAQILQDQRAGVADVLAYLADNPGFAVETAIPSLPSVLIGAGAGRAAGVLNAAVAARRGGSAAEVASAFQTGARAGAGAGNAALNAADTFSETDGDVLDKLLAAVPAAAGTALAARMPGAEAAIAGAGARGGALARVGATALAEGAQESAESLSQSLGKGTVEGNFDLGQSAKQAAVEGVAGAIIGGPAGLAGRQEDGAGQSLVDLARSKGFLGGQQPVNFTPAGSAVDRAGITPVVAPAAPGAAPQVDGAVDIAGITPAAGARQDFTKAMAAVADRAEAEGATGAAEKPQPAVDAGSAAAAAPVTTWTGRSGAGYLTRGDAEQALVGRQRKDPDYEWLVERRQDGRFELRGYTPTTITTETTSGRPAAGTAVDAGAAGAGQAAAGVEGAGTGVQPGGAGSVRAAGAAAVGGAQAPAIDPTVAAKDLKVIEDARLKKGEVVKLQLEQSQLQPEVAMVAATFGSPVALVRDVSSKGASGFGAVVIDKKRIYINVNAPDAAMALTIHEVVHTLPAGIRQALVERAMRFTTPELKGKFLWKYQGYKTLEEAQQQEEMVAMFAQDDAKTPEFWESLREKLGDRDFAGLAKHILSKLNELMARVRKGDDRKFFTDVEAVRDLVTEALARAERGETFWADDLEVSGDGGVDVGEISAEEAGFSESAKRPYGKAPNSLMGYRKNGPQKSFAESKGYKHVEFVRVTWPDGSSMVDAMRGLNKSHTLERARRNWTDAENIEAISREEAEAADPGIGDAVDVQFSEVGKKTQLGDFEARQFKDGSIEVRGDAETIRGQLPDDVQGRVTKAGVRFVTSDAARVKAVLGGHGVAYSRAGAVLDRLPMTKDGRYLGAPPDYDTPAKITKLRRILRQLADEGSQGRFWYEHSSEAVLHMTGGNRQEARKFVALLAIYSPQAKVDANSTFALRAWAQYKAGHPIGVKTRVMDRKAKAALDDVDKFWSGEKTGNFFHNLLREIDETTADKQGATIDMWMMRAGQYPTDAPTKTQYAFMEHETNRLARDLGWEPQQVQAAIWVAMKARMENAGVKKRTEAKSEKRGWIRFDRNAKGKKVRVIVDAQKHRDNWIAMAMEHDVTKSDTAAAKFDFADGIRRHIGQVSWEARPGVSTGIIPGIHSATYAQQLEFQQAVQKAFYDDETGEDLLAARLGLLVDRSVIAPGVWENKVSPSTQSEVAMAPAKGDDGKSNVDDAQKKLLNVYASVIGLVARQEGVGWHRPFYQTPKAKANAVDIDVGRALDSAEVVGVEQAINNWMRDNGRESWNNDLAIIPSPRGVRLVNFGIITNAQLHKDVIAAVEPVLPDFEFRVFASDGNLVQNDWKVNQDGQGYVQGIGAEGRSDVLDWARDFLAPRVQSVFEEFADRYGWGDPGKVQFSEVSAGEDLARPAAPPRGPGARGDAGDGAAVVGIHYGTQEGLSFLSGSMFGRGIRGDEHARIFAPGVDKRLQRRVYFYLALHNADALPRPEAGLGQHVYRATLGKLLDTTTASSADMQRVRDLQRALGGGANAFESAVLDAGYRGYVSRDQGTAVVLNADVPVAYEGKIDWARVQDRLIERAKPRDDTRSDNGELVRKPSNEQMMGVIKARPELTKVAPSFRLQYGEARVLEAEAPAANEALAKHTDFQFSDAAQPDMFPEEFATKRTTTKTDIVVSSDGETLRGGNVNSAGQRIAATKQALKNFWEWFGTSDAVDERGRPLLLFHSTNSDISSFEVNRESTNNYGLLGDVSVSRAGIFMTPNRSFSQEYLRGGDGQNVMPIYASIKNPLDLRSGLSEVDEQTLEDAGVNVRFVHNIQNHWELFDNAEDGSNDFVDALKVAGYDGAIFNEGSPGGESDGGVTYVAFAPEQVKSAIGNRGSFDPTDPDIRFSDTPWYSALTRAIEKGPAQAPADQWRAFLKGLPSKGVKQDEITWSGIEEWLKLQTGKVPRQAVVDYLDANGVKVEEVVLGTKSSIIEGRDAALSSADMLGYETNAEALTALKQDYRRMGDAGRVLDQYDLTDTERDQLKAWLEAGDMSGDRTKYGKYTLPGGTNYREVLLTLPERRPLTAAWRRAQEQYGDEDPRTIEAKKAARAEAGPGSGGYKSSHWDQKNILAHIRLNDRTDADGKRVLFVEEIQSDFGQATKKQKDAIGKAVDSDFEGVVERMKKAGVLTVECD